MPQDEDLSLVGVPQARGASLLYVGSLAVLAVALVAEFLVAYSLLRDHPDHAKILAGESYAALAVGLLVLAGQAVLIFTALIRPYREAAIRVEHLAHALDQHTHRDALTGVLNRTAFDQLIVRELESLRRYGVRFCGIFLDVDGFRQVNEAQGYETGDKVLFDLAQVLKQHVRRSDFVFRWRSGRFLILASGIDVEQGRRFADKLAALVATHPFRQGVALTACLGVAQAQVEDTPELFVGRTKSALALAKEQGPGSVDAVAG
ncbi:MAG: GGDEF domain-containing protein [Humidesulfovibrio sp.]|uniref:GGDEF domain-containing protein n=1 Tax=Humidesulfovibrio sp. TaxID=2910988 RepID=UPI002736771B|nr:GGDEF domain-containing protein [Humidesulfovibrio sp.]MDP2847679.1 GGDEF domain-containing protein [Humidesulfovibrio sp.]